MKLQVVLHAIPRYNPDTVHDAADLHQKLENWINTLVVENNYSTKHLGLHFRMEVAEIETINQ